MKAICFGFAIMVLGLVSCQKNIEVKQVDHSEMASTGLKPNAQVVNEKDPICGMGTAEHTKDTAVFKGKTYGFCSAYCKDEFKKSPEKYAVK